jgi:predicted Zn-dependent protease
MKKLIVLIFMGLLALNSCTENEKVKESTPSIKREKISYTGSKQWAKDLVPIANCILTHSKLLNDLEKIESFDWTDDNGHEVLKKLLIGPVSEIKHYTSNYFAYLARKSTPGKSPVIAYTLKGKPDMYFNTRTNPRDVQLMIGTVCHEYGHIIGYGHGANGSHTTGVPNDLANLCVKHIEECL